MPRTRSSYQADKYPQELSISITQSTVDCFEVAEIPLPIPRFGSSASRPYVFELIRAHITIVGLHQANVSIYEYNVSTTPQVGAINLNDVRRIFHGYIDTAFVTSGHSTFDGTRDIDFGSHDGHGLLIGTDSIWVALETVDTGAQNSLHLDLEYRIITVSAAEYIGIIQSQQ